MFILDEVAESLTTEEYAAGRKAYIEHATDISTHELITLFAAALKLQEVEKQFHIAKWESFSGQRF